MRRKFDAASRQPLRLALRRATSRVVASSISRAPPQGGRAYSFRCSSFQSATTLLGRRLLLCRGARFGPCCHPERSALLTTVILSERSESKDLPIAVVLHIHPALEIDDTIPQSADPSASLRVTGFSFSLDRNRRGGGMGSSRPTAWDGRLRSGGCGGRLPDGSPVQGELSPEATEGL